MQNMVNNPNNKQHNKQNYEVIKNNQYTYVMTDKPYTQPRIFNLIKATRYRGIAYAIISSALFFIFNIEFYADFLPADVIMIFGFLYFKYILLNKVLMGEIKHVGSSTSDCVSIGGYIFSIIRSALLRPIIMIVLLFYRGYLPTDLFEIFKNGFEKCWWSYLIGMVFIGSAYLIFMKPAIYSVEDYHRKILRIMHNFMTPNTPIQTIEKPSTAPKFYGTASITSFHSDKKKSTSNSNVPTTNKTTTKPQNKTVTPSPTEDDVFGNIRVNRKRRDI